MRGIHLRLPGGGPTGPTLEIFQYDPSLDHPTTAANRPGFGGIAFVVPDVTTARDTIPGTGGGPVGEIVTMRTADGRRLTWCYVTDPEANIVELQAWSNG